VAPNWSAAGNGIPSVPINAFAIDPANSNSLFAGTDIGVYHSTDGGANWSPYGVGLPRSAVFDMAIQPTNRILRVATHGRGIWETDVITAAGPNSAEFSSSSAALSETLDQTTRLDLTVIRSGDTSGAATIDYASADGTASERSDYMAARGTLFFAASETSKTIPIFIVDDRFGEGPETFTVNLSNPVNCTLGSQTTFTVTINSNEAVDGPNPVKDASFNTDFFVRQHYLDFLNREPDSSGLGFWKNEIDSCTTAQCREIKRINVSAAFFLSIEFQETGYLVYKLYKAGYGNIPGAPAPLTYGEFLPDSQQIALDVQVGIGAWQAKLESNKVAFTNDFVNRTRFSTAYPTTVTPAQFVDALITNAGFTATPAERQSFIDEFGTATTTVNTAARARALRRIAENGTFDQQEKNRAFVLMEYFGYLRRNPYDPPEQTLDYGGYNFWLTKLNNAGGNYITSDMVKSFLVSGEYRHRFGP
jgi:hypothetical protein